MKPISTTFNAGADVRPTPASSQQETTNTNVDHWISPPVQRMAACSFTGLEHAAFDQGEQS